MAVDLVREVIAYLQTPAAQPLTPAERLALLAIADRAHEKTRRAFGGGRDRWDLGEILGVRVSDVMARLERHKLICRVQVGTDACGRPMYAHRGASVTYCLPTLFASATADQASATAEQASATAAQCLRYSGPPTIHHNDQNGAALAELLDADPRAYARAVAGGNGRPKRSKDQRKG